jgi:hypothetical protein
MDTSQVSGRANSPRWIASIDGVFPWIKFSRRKLLNFSFSSVMIFDAQSGW